MTTDLPPELLAELFPEDLDLYYVWNWDSSISRNVAEIIRWFPRLSSERRAYEELADDALKVGRIPPSGEFYLFSGTEEKILEAAMRARSIGVAYVIRRVSSGEKWEPQP